MQENFFRKNPLVVEIYDLMGNKKDEIRFVSSHAKIGGDIFEDAVANNIVLDLFPEDSVRDLKNKIFLATNIYPCEQYLTFPDKSNIGHYVTPHFEDTQEQLANVPINKNIYNVRETIVIEDLEYMTMQDIFQDKEFKIHCTSLAEIKEWPDNTIDREILYWSLVVKFPYFNYEAFIDYIEHRHDKFPLLFPEKSLMLNNYNNEINQLNAIYDLIATKDLSNYNISLLQDINNKRANLKFQITELQILIQKRGIPDLANLFKLFKTTERMPIVILNDRTVTYSKVYFRHENKIPLKLFKNKNSAVYIVVENVIFEINKLGYIFTIFNPKPGEIIDFKLAESIVNEKCDMLFRALNELEISVFSNDQPIDLYEITKISATLTWQSEITDFVDFMTGVKNTSMIELRDENRFYWTKGTQYSTVDNWNEFEYLENNEFARQPFNHFEIINKYSEVVINIFNISEDDFKKLLKYMIYHLYNAKKSTRSSGKVNNLKLLRNADPLNYNFGKLNNGKVYGRFCQKQKQPLPITPEEFKNIKDRDRVMEFWNYTREEKMHYHCPNDKFPHPGFSVGYHPENNCLICCKKKKNEGIKYQKIFEECMTNHKYSNKKDTSQARYIINFGKTLEQNRLGNLPELINKFLVYNLEDINIISESLTMKILRYHGRVYSITRLFKIARNTKAQTVPTALFADFLQQPVWRRKRRGEELIRPGDVLANPDKDRKYKKQFKKIQEADMSWPIYVYNDKTTGKMVIIDGNHRLAHAFYKKMESVNIKFITKKQMDRCFIGKYDVSDVSFISDALSVSKIGNSDFKHGSNDKEPFYYILGTQHVVNDVMCSFATAVAAALEIPFDQFIKEIIDKLKKIEIIGTHVTGDLIEKMNNDFIRQDLATLTNWNETFYDILPVLYNFVPIVMDYVDNYNVNLVLQYKYENWENDKFIILLKTEEFYYPVFVAIPYMFAKNKEVEKRIYDYDEEIIHIFENLVNRKKQESEFTMNKVIESGYHVHRVMNFAGYIYALEIKKTPTARETIYVSVEKSKTNEFNFDKIELNKYDANATFQFLIDYAKKHNMPISFQDAFLDIDGNVRAYNVNGFVNFINCTQNEFEQHLKKMNKDVPRYEQWNYDPEIIMNAKANKEDPLLSRYLELTNKRNEYSYFKQARMNGKKFASDNNDVYEKALQEEMKDPLKKMLFDRGVFNFQKLYMHKQKTENIYIKMK